METASLHYLNFSPEIGIAKEAVIDLVVLLHLTTWKSFQSACDVVEVHGRVYPAH